MVTFKQQWSRFYQSLVGLLMLLLVPSLSLAETQIYDPWEGFNRTMFRFNDTLDRNLLKPVAKGYKKVTPKPVRSGVNNFFSNLNEIPTITNGLLQGKFGQAGMDTARFLINTTVGLFGFIDVGSRIGLPKHDEDFGQTLGYWGVASGPYLVLPFFGPKTLRDAGGDIPDNYLDNLADIEFADQEAQYGALGLKLIDMRAQLLSAEGVISGDRYTFIRDAYLQRREFLINDGKMRDPFLEDDLDDELLFEEELE